MMDGLLYFTLYSMCNGAQQNILGQGPSKS